MTQLTHGAWRVHQILEVADGDGLVYFLGRPLKSWDTQVMRLKLAGGEPEIVTKDPGGHRASVSPDGAFVLDTWTSLTTPTRVVLRRGDGVGRPRHRRRGLGAGFARVAWGRAELFTIPSSDGKFQLPAYWILPPDFSPKRQYPVIFTIYGGPDAGIGAGRLAVAVGALLGPARRHHDQRRSPRQRPLRQGRHRADAPPARDVGDDRPVHRCRMAAHEAVRPGGSHRHHRVELRRLHDGDGA